MNQQNPLPRVVAARAVLRCIGSTVQLLACRRVHLPKDHVGMRLCFADGTSAPVFRETVVDLGPTLDPCMLVVEFRLRLVRGWAHALFRRESLLNTPLFVGFPGFVSKLWLAHDQNGVYRGVYQWDGPARAGQLRISHHKLVNRALPLGGVYGQSRREADQVMADTCDDDHPTEHEQDQGCHENHNRGQPTRRTPGPPRRGRPVHNGSCSSC
jgi:hypothetical protein